MGEVSVLLAAASAGDRAAADRAFELVYADLRRLARRQLRAASPGPGATSLVHEVWLRVGQSDALNVNDREHFFALAARAMRQLVVDHARARSAAKRGGGAEALDIDELADRVESHTDSGRLIELDIALQNLAAQDADLVRLVEMRFFAGLELEEIAALTGRSERSLKRDWRKARALLHSMLDGDPPQDG